MTVSSEEPSLLREMYPDRDTEQMLMSLEALSEECRRKARPWIAEIPLLMETIAWLPETARALVKLGVSEIRLVAPSAEDLPTDHSDATAHASKELLRTKALACLKATDGNETVVTSSWPPLAEHLPPPPPKQTWLQRMLHR